MNRKVWCFWMALSSGGLIVAVLCQMFWWLIFPIAALALLSYGKVTLIDFRSAAKRLDDACRY